MDTDLYRAAISGDISVLREKERTLGVGDQLTPDKNSVLHVASESGKTEFVREILSMHPSLLYNLNSRSETALHLAVREGHSLVVKALIDEAKKSLVPPHEKDLENGVGSSTLKEMLRTANVEGDTTLHEGARYNQVDAVRVLIEEFPEENSLYTPNMAGETPLYLATYRGFLNMMKTICGTCSSPAYNGPNGRTALHAAIIHDRPESYGGGECVKYLLGWRKDLIKETDEHGWTAFHYAAYYGQADVIEQLIGVDKSMAYLAEKNGNRTALHIVAARNSITDNCIAVMKKLIAVCPDSCYMIDKRGQNILHIAVVNNDKEMIECIFQNCPSMSRLLIQKDNDGNTPLHLLAISGCFAPEIIQHHMADKEALNKENLTPLDVLSKYEEATAEQVKVGFKLKYADANCTRLLWKTIRDDEDLRTGKNPIMLAAEKAMKKAEAMKEKERERTRRLGDTHMIVAALVATVTFTAGFTVPGGFNGNEGPNQGMAILARNGIFKAFMVTDAIAFLLSISSLIIYFIAAIYTDSDKLLGFYTIAAYMNIVAIGAMMFAFITGTYVVLAHSLGLAITVCVIGCCFFVVLFLVIKKRFRDIFVKRQYKLL